MPPTPGSSVQASYHQREQGAREILQRQIPKKRAAGRRSDAVRWRERARLAGGRAPSWPAAVAAWGSGSVGCVQTSRQAIDVRRDEHVVHEADQLLIQELVERSMRFQHRQPGLRGQRMVCFWLIEFL